ncbi:MAG: hypothetical protein ACRET2_13570, partial [Steroidobacteraceae bacterium]
MRPYSLERDGKAGTNAGDVILTTDDVSYCGEHVIACTAGTLVVEVAVDEKIHAPAEPSAAQITALQWSDSSSFPIAVMPLNTTTPSTWVTSITAGERAVLTGRFDRIRLKQ